MLLQLLLAALLLSRQGVSAIPRLATLLCLPQPQQTDPHRQLMSLALSHLTSAALKVFVDLDLADRLHDHEPRSVDQLIPDDTTNWNADAILRVLRLLDASAGVVEETDVSGDSTPTFVLTPMGTLLQTEGPANMIRHWMDGPLWNAWTKLPQLCRDSSVDMFAASAHPAPSSWQEWYSTAPPASLQAASGLQEWISDLENQACLDGFPWESLHGKKILELGGHHGTFLTQLSTLHPKIDLACLDLPQVIQQVPLTELSAGENDHSVAFVAGDLLDPSTWPLCDAIFMKHIVFCDWNEHASLRILQQCATHLQQTNGGLVFIAEACVDTEHDDVSALADVFLLLDTSRQRGKTRKEWAYAAAQCGFQLVTVRVTATPTCSLLVLQLAESRPPVSNDIEQDISSDRV